MFWLFLFAILSFSAIKAEDEDVNLNIKVGDSGYEGLNFVSIPKNMEKTYHITTDRNAKLSLVCPLFFISTTSDCKDGQLTVTSGGMKKVYCGNVNEVAVMSENNKMDVVIKSGDGSGRLSCLVQAVTGEHLDQYRNAASYELDSSEYGGRPGAKSTTCKCGWANKKATRIVNGEEAKENEYPWMVALWINNTQMCGGSIITQFHVLTAAHCTVKQDPMTMKILAGSNSRLNRGGQIVRVEKIINHQFKKNKHNLNDISILLLSSPIKFSQTVGPVCLGPKHPRLDHQYITVMGWGYLGSEGRWKHPEMLMKTHMKVVDYPTCNSKFFGSFDRVKQSRLCTWAKERDSCMGDSGGPLVWLEPDTNRYMQVGLVSFGKGCNTEFPKVNTDVSFYYDWIQKTVKETKPNLDVCSKAE